MEAELMGLSDVVVAWVNSLRLLDKEDGNKTALHISCVENLSDGRVFSLILNSLPTTITGQAHCKKLPSKCFFSEDPSSIYESLSQLLKDFYSPSDWINFKAASNGDSQELIKILMTIAAKASLSCEPESLFRKNPSSYLPKSTQIILADFLEAVVTNKTKVDFEILDSLITRHVITSNDDENKENVIQGFRTKPMDEGLETPHVYQCSPFRLRTNLNFFSENSPSSSVMKNSLSHYKARVKALEALQSDYTEEVNCFKKENEELKHRNEQLESEIDHLKLRNKIQRNQEIDLLEYEPCCPLKEEHERLLNNSNAKLAKIEAECEELSKKLQTYMSSTEENENTVSVLKKTLSEMSSNLQDTLKKLDQSENNIASLSHLLNAKEEECNSLIEENAGLREIMKRQKPKDSSFSDSYIDSDGSNLNISGICTETGLRGSAKKNTSNKRISGENLALAVVDVQLQESKGEVIRLSTLMETKEKEITKISERYEREMKNWKLAIERLTTEKQMLVDENNVTLRNLKTHLQESNDTVSLLREEIGGLKDEREVLMTSIHSLESEKKNSAEKNEELEARVLDLKVSLDKSKQATISMTTELKECQNRYLSLKDATATLNVKITELEESNQYFQAVIAKHLQRNKELDTVVKKLQEEKLHLEEKFSSQAEQNEKLQKECEAKKEKIAGISSQLELLKLELNSSIEDKELTNKKLNDAANKINSLQQTHSNREKHIVNLEKLLEKAKENCEKKAEAMILLEQKFELSKEQFSEEIELKNSQHFSEMTSTKQQLSDAKSKVNDLQLTLHELNIQHDEKVALLKKDLTSLKEELERSKKEVTARQSILQELESSNTSLLQDLEEQKTLLRATQQTETALKHETGLLKEKLCCSQKEIESVRIDLTNCKLLCEELEHSRKKAEEQISELNEKADLRFIEHEKEKSQIVASHKAELEVLKLKFSEAKSAMESQHTEKISEIKKIISEKESGIELLQTELAVVEKTKQALIDDLTVKIECCEKHEERLNEELLQKQKCISKLEESEMILKGKVAQLKSELTAESKAYECIKKQMQSTDLKYYGLAARLKESEIQYELLTEKHSELTAKFEASQAELLAKVTELEGLKHSYDAVEGQMEELKGKNQSLIDEIEDIKKMKCRLYEENSILSAKIDENEQKVISLRAAKVHLSEEISVLNSKLGVMGEERKQSKIDLIAIKDKYGEKDLELNELKDNMRVLSKKNEDLHEETKLLTRKISSLEADLEMNHQEKESNFKELCSSKQKLDQTQIELEVNMTANLKLKETMEELEKKVKHAEIKSFEEIAKVSAKYEKELVNLKNKLDSQKMDMQNKYDIVSESYSSMVKSYKDSEAQLQAKEIEIENLKNSHELLVDETNKIRQSNDSLVHKVSEMNELKSQLNNCKISLNSMCDMKEREVAEKLKIKKEYLSACEKHRALVAKLEASEAQISAKNAELEALNNSIQKLTSKIDEIESSNKKLMGQLSVSSKSKSQLAEQHKLTLEEELRSQKSELRVKYEKKFEDLKLQMKKMAQDELEAKESKISSLEDKIEEFKRTRALMRSENIELHNKLYRLEETLKDTENKLHVAKSLSKSERRNSLRPTSSMIDLKHTNMIEPEMQTSKHCSANTLMAAPITQSSGSESHVRNYFNMQEEEDNELFSEKNLAEMKRIEMEREHRFDRANYINSRSTLGPRPRANDIWNDESPSRRICEIQRRNTLLPLHLRDSYAPESLGRNFCGISEQELKLPKKPIQRCNNASDQSRLYRRDFDLNPRNNSTSNGKNVSTNSNKLSPDRSQFQLTQQKDYGTNVLHHKASCSHVQSCIGNGDRTIRNGHVSIDMTSGNVQYPVLPRVFLYQENETKDYSK